MWDETMKWVMWMGIFTIIAFCNCYFYKFSFGKISQNIIFGVRQALYSSILNKNIGFFDNRDHAPGILR